MILSESDDLKGMKFYRWKVKKYAGRIGKEKVHAWKCKCRCGSRRIVRARNLIRGISSSCGCYQKERTAEQGRKNKTHGQTGTSIYAIWQSMIQRCTNSNAAAWDDYGGRGIRVCKRWRNSFEKFLKDMGDRPGPKYEIDRKDNNGNYTPANCRWGTRKRNNRNKRSNRMEMYKGKTKPVIYWAEKYDISPFTIYDRLDAGWSISRAIETPVAARTRITKSVYTYKGASGNVRFWAKRLGLLYSSLYSRLMYGWSFKKAVETPIRVTKNKIC